MNKPKLSEIEGRAEGAIGGPWSYEVHANGRAWIDMPDMTHALGLHGFGHEAVFVAHSRTDVPALTAAIRAVLAIVEPQWRHTEGEDYSRGRNAVIDAIRDALAAHLDLS